MILDNKLIVIVGIQLIFIFIAALIGLNVLKRKAINKSAPEKELAIKKFFNGLSYMYFPFGLLAIGIFTGNLTDLLDIIAPHRLNLFVLMFYTGIILCYFFMYRYLFLKGGAAFIANTPNLLPRKPNAPERTEAAVKRQFLFLSFIPIVITLFFLIDLIYPLNLPQYLQ